MANGELFEQYCRLVSQYAMPASICNNCVAMTAQLHVAMTPKQESIVQTAERSTLVQGNQWRDMALPTGCCWRCRP